MIWGEMTENGEVEIKSHVVGGSNKFESWSKLKSEFTLDPKDSNDQIRGFLFGLGTSFCTSLSIISKKQTEMLTYGYPDKRITLIPVMIPENATIVGFSCKAGWVIDSIQFRYSVKKNL